MKKFTFYFDGFNISAEPVEMNDEQQAKLTELVELMSQYDICQYGPCSWLRPTGEGEAFSHVFRDMITNCRAFDDALEHELEIWRRMLREMQEKRAQSGEAGDVPTRNPSPDDAASKEPETVSNALETLCPVGEPDKPETLVSEGRAVNPCAYLCSTVYTYPPGETLTQLHKFGLTDDILTALSLKADFLEKPPTAYFRCDVTSYPHFMDANTISVPDMDGNEIIIRRTPDGFDVTCQRQGEAVRQHFDAPSGETPSGLKEAEAYASPRQNSTVYRALRQTSPTDWRPLRRVAPDNPRH